MKAISIVPGRPGIEFMEAPIPEITTPRQVKIKVLEVGICGTDREEVSGGRANAPDGTNHLIIGHEMIGRVIEIGSETSLIKIGDLAVVTVRRGCGRCEACLKLRSDLCYTGNYSERGIKNIHGFETCYIVDDEEYVIKVPENIRNIGILAEPMSIAQKAINEAINFQLARFGNLIDSEWMKGKRVVVAGIGAVGLLAAVALRLRGALVTGIDIVDEGSKRSSILKRIGGNYLNATMTDIRELNDTLGQIDFIFEAAGVPKLGFDLIDALGINGVYVMTGIPGEGKPICFPAAETMAAMVLKNQVIFGSVNASVSHFAMGIKDLEQAKHKWHGVIEDMVTNRVDAHNFDKAINFRDVDDIKTVVVWDNN